MSLLTQQTNANPLEQYFIRANGKVINVSTINANTISTNLLETDSVSTTYLSAYEGTFSTFSTAQVDIDGQLLTATATELLLNGIPVATLSSLSSIGDWSLQPAISTVQMAGNNLLGASTISCITLVADQGIVATNLNVGNGIFNNLVAFNSLFVSSNTSTISSLAEFADLGVFSTISAGTIIATAGNFSTVGAEAISTAAIIGAAGNFSTVGVEAIAASTLVGAAGTLSTLDAGAISTGTIIAGVGTFSTLNTNAVNVSSITTDALTISSLTTSTLNAGLISSGSIQATSATFSTLSASTFTGYTAGSNWSQYTANSDINFGGFNTGNAPLIYNNDGISIESANSNVQLKAASKSVVIIADDYVRNSASYVSTGTDAGADITANSYIRLNAVNGAKGEISLTAGVGYANNGGVVNITAEGGVTPLGVAYGGEVNILATTGTFTSLAFTSAVNLNAAGINSYAGATFPIGSIAGYNFIHGDSGVNITAGIPPIASDPLCVYLRGTNGTLIEGTSYIQKIRPYSDLVTPVSDLYIEAYTSAFNRGYIQLRGVSTQTFEGPSLIDGLNRLNFSTGGQIDNLSTINGVPVGNFENPSTISSFTEVFTSSLYVSEINQLTGTGIVMLGSTISIESVDASLNSGDAAVGVNVNGTTSTVQIAAASSIQLFPGLGGPGHVEVQGDLDAANMSASTIAVVYLSGVSSIANGATTIFIDSFSIDASAASTVRLRTAGLEEILLDGPNQDVRINAGNDIYIQAATGGPGTIFLNGDVDIDGNLLAEKGILTSTISTQVLFGADPNLFGLGISGLTIQTEAGGQVFISTSQTNIQGNINASSLGAFGVAARNGGFSTVGVSSLTASTLTLDGTTLSTFGLASYGSWYSSTSQVVAGANTETPLTYTSETLNVGGFSYAGSTITVPTAGNYELATSIQFETASNQIQQVFFWAKKNGTDIPQTGSIVSVVKDGQTLGNISLFDTAAAGDQYAFCFASADTSMTAVAYPVSSFFAAIPAVITSIKRLG